MTASPPVVDVTTNFTVPDRRRRPWIAALLTLVLSGLGQLYAGRARRAACVWVFAFAVSAGITTRWMSRPTPGRIAAAVLLGLGVRIGLMVDAALVARRAPVPFALRRYNRWYVYVSALLIQAVLLYAGFTQARKDPGLQAFRLPTGSMEPSWMAGDYIVTVPIKHLPLRGEVVVYRLAGVPYLKRVVAIPGDTVAMSNGQLSIDGDTVSEPYARRGDPYASDPPEMDSTDYYWQNRYLVADVNQTVYRPTLKSWGPLVVPDSDYFVLGDNRDESVDSRMRGFVPAGAIFARPLFVYWSWDADDRSIRWNRFGMTPPSPKATPAMR